ncbi:MAG: hypothetical protein ACJ8CR_14530 [Roseiflexaceae bacterium]
MIVHINQDTRSGFIRLLPDVHPFTDSWFDWLQNDTNIGFAIYDDNPIDDDKLCSMQKEGDTWYVVYEGHKHTYREVVGSNRDMTYTNVWNTLRQIWNQANKDEGSLRRQF